MVDVGNRGDTESPVESQRGKEHCVDCIPEGNEENGVRVPAFLARVRPL